MTGFYGALFPVTGGHEIAGYIEEIGPNVTGLSVGDRVIALNKTYECGKCLDCRILEPA